MLARCWTDYIQTMYELSTRLVSAYQAASAGPAPTRSTSWKSTRWSTTVVQVPDERPASVVAALERAVTDFAAQGVHIERVLTDNDGAYRSHAYAAARARIGARHKRTRPYRPQTNGTAERFIKTLLEEWAYARPYRSSEERLSALPDWVRFHDHGRPHTAIDGLVPQQALVDNLSVNHN